MTVEDYQEQTEALAARTAVQVAAINAALRAGDIAAPDAELLIGSVVNTANQLATMLADHYVSVSIETATGTATPTSGVARVDDQERITEAVRTVLDAEEEQQPMRLERLARAEPLEAGQRAITDAMESQPGVEGWTRHMDADPCQLCRWWWREGRIWPKEHPFQSHKGCNCQPKIVVAEHIQSTGYTRKLERNRAR